MNNKISILGISSLIISLLFPFAWMVFLGESSTTPIVEKKLFENMSEEQISAWIKQNSTNNPFVDHVKSVSNAVVSNIFDYLKYSFIVFVVVFSANLFLFKLKRTK